LPPSLEVRELRIDDVEIDGLGTPVHIETLAGSVRAGSVELDRVVVGAAGATLDASGDAALDAGRATGALAGSIRLAAETAEARPRSGSDDAAAASAKPNPAPTIAFDTTFTFEDNAGSDAGNDAGNDAGDNAGDDAWRASIDWSRLEWRSPGGAAVASPSGSVVVQPRADGAFDVSVQAAVEGEPLPGPAMLTAN